MIIKQITSVTSQLVADINHLLPQLSQSAHSIDASHVQQIIASPLSYLFVAQEEEHTIGMISIAGYWIPSGLKFQLEDVVTDISYRGQGIAHMLIEHALNALRKKHPGTSVHLTSRPSREAANALYSKIFTIKDTNNYVIKL